MKYFKAVLVILTLTSCSLEQESHSKLYYGFHKLNNSLSEELVLSSFSNYDNLYKYVNQKNCQGVNTVVTIRKKVLEKIIKITTHCKDVVCIKERNVIYINENTIGPNCEYLRELIQRHYHNCDSNPLYSENPQSVTFDLGLPPELINFTLDSLSTILDSFPALIKRPIMLYPIPPPRL